MPYPRKQAVAIFLDKKRREGEGVARAFARKHSADMSSSRSYRTRKARGGDIGDAEARNRGKSDAAQGNRTRRRRRKTIVSLSEGVNQRPKRS